MRGEEAGASKRRFLLCGSLVGFDPELGFHWEFYVNKYVIVKNVEVLRGDVPKS